MKPALPSKLDPSATVADQTISYRRTRLHTARHWVCTKCLLVHEDSWWLALVRAEAIRRTRVSWAAHARSAQ